MKDKKFGVLISISAVVIVVIVALFLILRSCDNQNSETGDTVAQLLNEAIVQEIYEGEDLPLSFQYVNAIVSSTKYEIISATEQSTAIVKFEYIDALKLADNYTGNEENPDDFYQYCIQTIKDGSAPKLIREFEVELEYNEADGTYNLVDSIELADALTGGMASAYSDILNGKG